MKTITDGRINIAIPTFGYVQTLEETLDNFREFIGVSIVGMHDLFWRKATQNPHAMVYFRSSNMRTWKLARLNKIRKKIPKALLTAHVHSVIILN